MASTHSSGGICLANLSLKTLGVISSKKNLFPTTFGKMSRPKVKTYFGRYQPKQRSRFENTFWGACLKTFSRDTNMVSKQLPNRSLNFFLGKYPPRLWKNTLRRCWTVFENGFGRYFRKRITSGICCELFDDHLWEMFPKIFLILQGWYGGEICPSMFLALFQAYLPEGMFKRHAVFLGDISQKNRHLPKDCWKQIILWRYHPEGL